MNRRFASLVLALDLVHNGAEFLKSALVLGASLTPAVAEVGPVCLWLWLGDGFGDGFRGPLDFGTSLTSAVTEAGPVGLYRWQSAFCIQ